MGVIFGYLWIYSPIIVISKEKWVIPCMFSETDNVRVRGIVWLMARGCRL